MGERERAGEREKKCWREGESERKRGSQLVRKGRGR